MPYDLLLSGGRVLDPGRRVDAPLDVAINGSRIARVAPDIPASEARRWLDVRGMLVTPGLIDVHAHVYEHGTDIGMDPDKAGVHSGVTTIVDAGSAGSATYDGFHHHVIKRARTRVLTMLHLARGGLAFMPEIRDAEDISLDATVATVDRYRGEILGIKVRAVGPAVREMGVDLIKKAREAAAASRTRVMVHIGDPLWKVEPTLTRRLLPLLAPGDIVTHLYTGAPGRLVDDNGHVLPEILDAKQRGLVFDIAHGRYNMNFDVAKRLMDAGIVPLTISTDLTPGGRDDMLKSMNHVMNKFLALGFPLHEVVRMATFNAAGLIGMQAELGTLAEGTTADVSVLQEVQGDWTYADSQKQTLSAKGTRALRPVLTVKDGVQYDVEYGPFPWGWLPNTQPS